MPDNIPKDPNSYYLEVLSIQPVPELDSIDDIIDDLAVSIDRISYLAVRIFQDHLEACRRISPECADELEFLFDRYISDKKFGTGWSSELKTNVLRKIQRKYRKE